MVKNKENCKNSDFLFSNDKKATCGKVIRTYLENKREQNVYVTLIAVPLAQTSVQIVNIK